MRRQATREPADRAAHYAYADSDEHREGLAAFIEKRPATIQSVANAMRKSLAWLTRATPSDVADIVPAEYLGGDRDLYVQAFAKFREALAPPQLISMQAAHTGVAVAAAFNPTVKAESIDVAATFDNRFMQIALQKAGQ